MNASPSTVSEAVVVATAPTAAMRPFYWSVRRELWEHRSLYFAPLVAAALVVLGFLVNAMHLPGGLRILASLDADRQRAAITTIYGSSGVLIVWVMSVVALFYCLDALHGERRNRGILFWKSLPVSDLTAVLAKAFIPTVVAPLIAFAISAATQLLLLLLGTGILLANGVTAATLWNNLPLLEIWLVHLYAMMVLTLWYAPVYAWLLLVSAWARRSVFLWAILPPLAIVLVESIALNTNYFGSMLRDRLMGGFAQVFGSTGGGDAFASGQVGVDAVRGAGFSRHLAQLIDPVKFLSTPSLWIGLVAAAAFIAAAVWMRRYREPL